MLSENNHVLILKNDAVGDLCQSLTAINNIIHKIFTTKIPVCKAISTVMNHSIFKLNWWNGHNVTILLIVIIEFRFHPNQNPNNPPDCHYHKL